MGGIKRDHPGGQSAKALRLIVTAVAAVAVVVHLIWPSLSIDAITAALLVVGIAPWLAPLLKSLEVPGGLKMEFHELQEASDKADRAGLLEASDKREGFYSFELVADEDPNLALAGLRIEIERRLHDIAQARNIPARRTVGGLLRSLREAEALSGEEQSVIADMVGLLNSAAHGAQVDDRAAQWALDVGPRLLRVLDQRTEARKVESSNNALQVDRPSLRG